MFSQEISYEEKIDALQNEFKISVTSEISEEVLNVCNLSTGVYNKGYDSGYDSGYDTGISAGELKKARESTYNFYDMGLPVEQIAKGINVGVETVKKWLADREAAPVK